MKSIIHVLGGGTFNHVRSHLALSAPAFGNTARQIAKLCEEVFDKDKYEVRLHLTKMADSSSSLVTNDDVAGLVRDICNDKATKIIFMNIALTDFVGTVDGVEGGKYAPRLKTSDGIDSMLLFPAQKIISSVRAGANARKDIFLVGFKTTCNATSEESYKQALNMLKASSVNLVLANDVVTRTNMIVAPEEAVYHESKDREHVLRNLVDMVLHRSELTFTKSVVVDDVMTPWRSPYVPDSLREVVDYCIDQGAYKTFRGVTAGHFAVKVKEGEFLTSPRKRNFNDLANIGLVKIDSVDDRQVIAHGAKPSVGGQSQRIIFNEHADLDCIVHFHSTIKTDSLVPIVSQREFECGSHECGANTSRGIREIEPGIFAVYLDNHGPNIVYNRRVPSFRVIDFIERNFNLMEKSGGYAIS